MSNKINLKNIIGASRLNHSGEQEVQVKMYDFKRPDKFSKDQLRTLQMIHETLGRIMTVSLSAQLRTMISIHLTLVDQLTFEEFMSTIDNPNTIGIIHMTPLNGTAILQIDPCITFSIIDRIFGGAGNAGISNRELTDTELAVMEAIYTTSILPGLNESWPNILPLQSKLGNIETNPQFASIVPPNDMIVQVSFDIQHGKEKGRINVILPYITIEPIIYKFSAQYWYSSIRKGDISNETPVIRSLKTESQVFIEAENISLNDISNLKKNTLIRLPGFNQGEALIESGGNPVLKLIKQEKSKNRDMAFSVADYDNISDIEMNIILPEKQDKEQRNKWFVPMNDYVQQIKSSIDVLGNKVNDLVERQDELSEQIFYETGADTPEKLLQDGQGKPFAFIQVKDVDLVTAFLTSEHPQLIALVLSYLDPHVTADVLSRMADDLQVNVIERIALLEKIAPAVLREVERVFIRKIQSVQSSDYTSAGGIKDVVEILNLTSRSMERNIIHGLDKKNPDLSAGIKKNMFVFEDVIILTDDSMKKLIRKIKNGDLAVALKTVTEDVQEHFFHNMSAKDADKIKKDISALGPIRLIEVETAQQRIVNIIRELEESGEIVVARQDELV